MRTPIRLGGGSRMNGTPAPRVMPSQMIRIQTPKMNGISSLRNVLACRSAGRIAESSATHSQASSQAAASSRKKESRAAPSEPATPASRIQAAACAPTNRIAARERPRDRQTCEAAAAARIKREDRAAVSIERRTPRIGLQQRQAQLPRRATRTTRQRRLPGKLDAAHAGRAPIERSTRRPTMPTITTSRAATTEPATSADHMSMVAL